LGAQSVEEDLVVAAQLDVLHALPPGEDVEGNIQDVIRFVIGEMTFEELEVLVDVSDQAGPSCQEEDGADAASGETPDALAQFIVDVGGGDHGLVAFGPRFIGNATEDSPPSLLKELAVAFSGFVARAVRGVTVATSRLVAVATSGRVGDGSSHSKPSVTWKNQDPLLPALFQRSPEVFEFS